MKSNFIQFYDKRGKGLPVAKPIEFDDTTEDLEAAWLGMASNSSAQSKQSLKAREVKIQS